MSAPPNDHSASATLATPLRLQRLALADAVQADPGKALGALVYGHSLSDAFAVQADVGARRLLQPDALFDAWSSSGPLVDGELAGVRWRHNGHWLFGAIDVHEPPGAALEEVSRQAYASVFAALREAGLPHLQRVWNYLPRINAEADGLERYRHFNAGRQQAFLDDGRDVLSGSPAACALGVHDGPLRVRFLAGRTPALPIENPRQVPAYRYPADYGARRPSFSRAALVDAGAGQIALLVSGTASIVDHKSVHIGDVPAQARETLVNLQAVIDAAHARTSARFELGSLECTVYIRDATHAEAIRALLASALGIERAARAVYLEADVCRSELMVEIEAYAFAPGRLIG